VVELSLPDRRYARVALAHELRGERLVPFERHGRRWQLDFERDDVARVEYLLEVEHRDGRSERMPDPGNPLRVPGVFGEKSVLEFDGYQAPAWIADEESESGELRPLPLESRALRTTVEALLWSAAQTDPAQPLPLLVVHDGPQYAEYSQLLRLLDHLVAFGELPPLRALLLPPPLDRGETYSASARYARALVDEWLPHVAREVGVGGRPVGLGASLGALSLLHAHWVRPDAFSALLLQSGSFFRRRFDTHESGFGRFARIVRFVSAVVGRRATALPVPVTMTCGTGEENLDNNRLLALALKARGWDAKLVEHPDAHNWVSWRDVLDPHLPELILKTL
jgi:enterochelin esterase family protein